MKNTIYLTLAFLCFLTFRSAYADMVVIVSVKNPTSSISPDDVEKIFLGKLKLFPNGSSAIPLDLPDKSSDKDLFYEKALRKTDSQLRAYWSRVIFTGGGAPPKAAGSPTDMVNLVSENPNTIGYVDETLLTDTVKVVWKVPQ